MAEPSAKRQRTLALHERAIRFSTNVNACCPRRFTDVPSQVVWKNLVRAADSTSNNLIEADDASSDADFIAKMNIAVREAKESHVGLVKLRVGRLDHHRQIGAGELESEAKQLAAIFAAIVRNMRTRIDNERARRKL